ncbi:riboflavin synthase [Secundilactobacillus muriivasis]
MFTGIIKGVGRVVQLDQQDETATLTLQADLFRQIQPQLGDSIAINGTCLTATAVAADQVTVEVMPETSRRTNLGALTIGSRVNLEPALQATARLDGHFVLGHVDTTAVLTEKKVDQNAIVLTFELAAEYAPYIVEKDSIAIDGVSLTITATDQTHFSVSLIPFTLAETVLGDRELGDRVNIETDILGKYIVANQPGGTRA